MKSAAKIALPPALKTDLIGGHFRSFRKAPTEFLTRLKDLGDVTSFRMGPQQGYFINDPDLIRDVFVVNAHKFMKGRALQHNAVILHRKHLRCGCAEGVPLDPARPSERGQ